VITPNNGDLLQRAVEQCLSRIGSSVQLVTETKLEAEHYVKGTKWDAKVIRSKGHKEWEILAVGFDITEQLDNLRTTEELLKQSKSQNLKLQTFSFVVSHSIRSQAANISGLLELISLDTHQEELNVFLKMLKSSCQNMDETLGHLNGLLELDRDLSAEFIWVSLYEVTMKHLTHPETLEPVIIHIEQDIDVKLIPAFYESALRSVSNYIYKNSYNNSWISSTKIMSYNEGAALQITYVPSNKDAINKGIKSFKPMESRIGNDDASSMVMYLAHEQLSSMNIEYDLSLRRESSLSVVLSLYFQKKQIKVSTENTYKLKGGGN
jgi:hypothetical protein